jgi:dihydroorotase-like cyclic amidohydrolase
MLSSDHSPSTPDLKLMEEGNFLKAWGGISSLQVSSQQFCVILHIFHQYHNPKLLQEYANSPSFFYNNMQFVLPVTWSHGKKYGITLNQLVSWWSEKPAELAGQKNKVTSASGCRGLFICFTILNMKHCNLKTLPAKNIAKILIVSFILNMKHCQLKFRCNCSTIVRFPVVCSHENECKIHSILVALLK